MIKFNPFKTLISKYGIENDEYKNWHRKFAFLPVRIDGERYWLCNVFRRREEYQHPSTKGKFYWYYVHYNDLELIKQAHREGIGEYKPLAWAPITNNWLTEMVLMVLLIFAMVGLTYFAVTVSLDRAERQAELGRQADKAQSLDELKTVVKELIQNSK